MEIALYPTKEQIEALLADASPDPVVMVNLLRFKPGGEAAYMRYGAAMRKIVESRGGRFVWSGRVTSQVVGAGADGITVVALVEYPSRKAFVEIATSPEVAEIGVHRAEGLEGQWLLAATAAPL
ncbi:MAG: DUF1330 domain-containing protein [Myxococcota bacterium]